MWTFKTIGEEEQANGFEATFDGPVEGATATLAVIAKKADELVPGACLLCQRALGLVGEMVHDAKNGKRRFSMNLEGGIGAQTAWSLRLNLNLAEDPDVP